MNFPQRTGGSVVLHSVVGVLFEFSACAIVGGTFLHPMVGDDTWYNMTSYDLDHRWVQTVLFPFVLSWPA